MRCCREARIQGFKVKGKSKSKGKSKGKGIRDEAGCFPP